MSPCRPMAIQPARQPRVATITVITGGSRKFEQGGPMAAMP